MKKGVLIFLGLVCLIGIIGVVSAEVRINEVMVNPNGGNNDHQWVELYNNGSEIINLTDWKLITGTSSHNLNIPPSSGGRGNLLIAPSEYLLLCQDATTCITDNPSYLGTVIDSAWTDLTIINYENISLKNANDSILSNVYSLFNGTEGLSLQSYNSSWSFCAPTPGAENNCTITPTCMATYGSCSAWSTCSGSSQTRTCINTSSSCISTSITETRSCTSTAEPYIRLNWSDEDIQNGEEFDISIRAYNLEDHNYDLKVWITFDDNDTIISERYDSEEDEWKSGTYYVINFTSGTGNKTKDITLRINEDYDWFYGDAKIYVRIRENIDQDEVYDYDKNIEVLKKSNAAAVTAQTASESPAAVSSTDTGASSNAGSVISLGKASNSSAINQDYGKNSIIYKSSSEYIKEYAPYAFSILCIALIILLLMDRK